TAHANYSARKLRIQLSENAGFVNQTIPADNGGKISGSNQWFVTSGIASYTLGKCKDNRKCWTVAVIASHATDPGSNVDRAVETAAGLEWSLVPFRTTENQELYFRAGSGL